MAVSVPLNIGSRPVRGHCDLDFRVVLAFRTVFSRESTMDPKNRSLFVAFLLCLVLTGIQAEVELSGCTSEIKDSDMIASVDLSCDKDILNTVVNLKRNLTEKVKAIIRTLSSSGSEQSRMEQSSDCVMGDISNGGIAEEVSPVNPCEEVTWMEGENVINGASVSSICDNSPAGENVMVVDVLVGEVECLTVKCDYEKF